MLQQQTTRESWGPIKRKASFLSTLHVHCGPAEGLFHVIFTQEPSRWNRLNCHGKMENASMASPSLILRAFTLRDHITSTHISLAMCAPVTTGPLTLNPRANQLCSPSTHITGKATGFILLGQSLYCHVYPSAKSRAKPTLRQIQKRVDEGADLLNAWSGERTDNGRQKQIIPLTNSLHFKILHFTFFFF